MLPVADRPPAIPRPAAEGGAGPRAGRLKGFATRADLLSRVLWNVMRGSVYRVNFDVTTHCNSRCLSCNVWKYYDEHPEDLSRELKLEEVETAFSNLPPSVCWLSVTGGEPFIRPDSEAILHAAADRIRGLRLISIPTNAMAKDKTLRVVESLLSRRNHPLLVISVSLDGSEETHDRVRGVPGGFRRSWDTYLALRELARADRNFHVCIETTVSSLNVLEVRPFLVDLLRQGHDVTLTIGHQGALYYNEAGQGLSPRGHPEEVARIVREVLALKRVRTAKDVVDRMYLARIPGFLGRPEVQAEPCASLASTVTINHFGEVMPCLMWSHPLGNLRDHGYRLGSILEGEKTRDARRMIQRQACPNCWTPCEAYQSIIARVVGRS